MTDDRFVLQFAPSKINGLAERNDYKRDDDALAAGKAIAGGTYSKDILKVIVGWKVDVGLYKERVLGLIDTNTEAEIASTLRFASAPRTSEKSAIDVLCRLHGVGIPVASAILTMIDPERYTIIDVRALESLGVSRSENSIDYDYYLAYLQKCRELAREHKVSLRTLDRALWQWSKENGKVNSAC